MPYQNQVIKSILRFHEIHWKLTYCPKPRLVDNEYRISIELKNKKRQYACLAFEDLLKLIQSVPIEERCYYEHISFDNSVKFYIDFEYCKSVQNAMIDDKKALLTIQKLFIDNIRTLSNTKNLVLDDMILLKSSNEQKESYHIIFDNPNIRFLNNNTLYIFITETFRITLLNALRHECLRKKCCTIHNLRNNSNLFDIINIFKDVWLEWFACYDCKLENSQLSVNDICNLFVHDQNGFITPCIDFKVYNKEQDFRLFMCTKSGEKRPLVKFSTNSTNIDTADVLSKNVHIKNKTKTTIMHSSFSL